MPNIGPMELIVVLVIALLILGPKRLPAAGRSLGQGMREFKRSITHGQRDADDDDAKALSASTSPCGDERRHFRAGQEPDRSAHHS
jgi:sec-independent protein translocase protein TatA